MVHNQIIYYMDPEVMSLSRLSISVSLARTAAFNCRTLRCSKSRSCLASSISLASDANDVSVALRSNANCSRACSAVLRHCRSSVNTKEIGEMWEIGCLMFSRDDE